MYVYMHRKWVGEVCNTKNVELRNPATPRVVATLWIIGIPEGVWNAACGLWGLSYKLGGLRIEWFLKVIHLFFGVLFLVISKHHQFLSWVYNSPVFFSKILL